MTLKAAVLGASGYAGGELLRLLHAHPEFEIHAVTANSHVGRHVRDVHPHLTSLSPMTFTSADTESVAESDVAFLALPHGESGSVAANLPQETLCVDLGADHRLADPLAWDRYYGGSYAGCWTYGLPELPKARDQISASSRVANPGCFPTAAILALAPVLQAGLVHGGDVVIVAATGTSGAGRAPRDHLMASEIMGSLSAYRAGGTHQHTPEIEQALSQAAQSTVRVSFTPVLAPVTRGCLVTCTAPLADSATTEGLRRCLIEAYHGEPFVQVTEEDTWPRTSACLGSNMTYVQAAADLHAGRAIVVAALDNLVKGAAGQAVQNANIMVGLPENAGLVREGFAP